MKKFVLYSLMLGTVATTITACRNIEEDGQSIVTYTNPLSLYVLFALRVRFDVIFPERIRLSVLPFPEFPF